MKMKDYLGEFLGTFILTLFGCSCVAVAVLFGELVRNVLVETLPDNCQEEVLAWRYLQPGRPNPTHRFNEAVQ